MHRGASGLPVYAELEPHPEHSKDMILKTEGVGPTAGVLKSGRTEVRAFCVLHSRPSYSLVLHRGFVPMTHDSGRAQGTSK